MNIQSIKRSTPYEFGSAVIELSERELAEISTLLIVEKENGNIDDSVALGLCTNMYLAHNLVKEGAVDGISISTLQKIFNDSNK